MKHSLELQKLFNNKKLIGVIVVVLLLGVVSLQSALSKKVTIRDIDKEITITTMSFKVKGAVKKADVTLGKYDEIRPKGDVKLQDGMVINIKRAFPVAINVDGKKLEVETAYDKVGEVLKQYNIKLEDKDRSEPSLDQTISANDTINIIRVKEEIAKEEVDIPFKSIIKYNDDMATGKIKKINEGKNGRKEVEYRIVYENGEEAVKEVLNEKVLEEPIDELVEKGSEKYLVASRGKVVRYKKALVMSSTAYDLSYESCGKYPDHPEYGITYSGTKARPGVVAVDPRVIPLGSKLYVESLDGTKDYGFASAEDTGGAIKGNKIDLFMESHKAAWRYGRRNVKVYILE